MQNWENIKKTIENKLQQIADKIVKIDNEEQAFFSHKVDFDLILSEIEILKQKRQRLKNLSKKIEKYFSNLKSIESCIGYCARDVQKYLSLKPDPDPKNNLYIFTECNILLKFQNEYLENVIAIQHLATEFTEFHILISSSSVALDHLQLFEILKNYKVMQDA